MRRWPGPAASWRDRVRRPSPAQLALVLVAVLFVARFASVLAGRSVMVGGGSLAGVAPWAGSSPPAANFLLSDQVLQMLPWQEEVRRAILSGNLPTWNSHALSGTPLLANDQSAVFSPFTWLALGFAPAVGLSIAMLAKLWVAGLGMALYVRRLGARGIAPIVAGVAFATCSFVTVWLGYPAASVAALMPWAFWAFEGVMTRPTVRAAALLSLVLALQFLAGHAESSLTLGTALVLYALVRLGGRVPRRVRLAGLLVAAGVWAVVVASVQLLPFLSALRDSAVWGTRAGLGAGHLTLSEAASWLVPNGHGSPAIDGLDGRPPNYAESTGYAGVAMLLLSPLGAWRLGRRARSAAAGLVLLTGLSAAIVYGFLSPVMVRLPLYESSNNGRFLAVLCLGVVALGAFGVDALEHSVPRRRTALGGLLTGLGVVTVAGLVAAWWLLRVRGAGVDRLAPDVAGMFGFWVAVAALAGVSTLILAAAAFCGWRRPAAVGILGVVLAEALLVALPYNPRLPPRVVPDNPAMAFIAAHAQDGSVAATGTVMLPNTAMLYGVDDVRGYDVLIPRRTHAYWSAADPDYRDSSLITSLGRPDVRRLALAGVAYVMTPEGSALPGTQPAYRGQGVTISRVPAPRPFAYAAAGVVLASDSSAATRMLATTPATVDVVESSCCAGSAAAGEVRVTSRGPAEVVLAVDGATPQTVVVRQTYDPGWQAAVDGSPARVVPANLAFQAVRVPAGHHVVTLRYAPTSVAAGALLSLVGVVGVGVGLALGARPIRRRRDTGVSPALPSGRAPGAAAGGPAARPGSRAGSSGG